MPTYDLSGKNKYYTLYKCIRGDILRGKFKKGDRLPSKRALAAELGVSVVTVQSAYEHLLAEGYVSAKERSGYFVEDVGESAVRLPRTVDTLPAAASENKRYAIDFTKGAPPVQTFPFSVWSRLLRAVLADSGEHLLERPTPDGDPELKRAIADYLYRSRGIDVSPLTIVVGAGAEHLYGVIVQLLGSGAKFAVENPGYGKISHTYSLYGAECVPVKVGKNGVDCDEVEASGATAVHVSPAHQYPTGAVTTAGARARLINWAKTGRYIIEDDYDSEFRLVGKPLLSMLALCPEKVIYVNTFSKSLAPSMRMGYMVLPPELYERYMRLFGGTAGIVPLFEQKTLAKMLDGGYFERHIRRLKNYYRGVREELLSVLSRLDVRHEVRDTGSGPHMVVKFPDAESDAELKRRAGELGIRVKCLSDFLLKQVEGYEKCAVLNYSGMTREQLSLFAGIGSGGKQSAADGVIK